MPTLANPFQTKRVIRHQQDKLRSEMKDLVVTKATGSRYSALKRSEKRRAEHHHDRVTDENNLQRDLKRAEQLARRIAQVLDQLRKDFNKMKNFAGNYNFVNTVGQDSSASGACENDLTTGGDTRQAWKQELTNMLTMAWHYVDAQHLGNYAIAHTVEGALAGANGGSGCCSKVYREAFHYITPTGDCLSMPTSAGQHSGNSNVVTAGDVTENSVDSVEEQETSQVVPAASTAEFAVTPTAEHAITAPSAPNHNSVQNCDLGIRNLWNMFASPTASVSEAAWTPYLQAEIDAAKATDGYASLVVNVVNVVEQADYIRNYLKTTTCLPVAMVDAFAEDASLVAGVLTATIATAVEHAPTIANIEDESDLSFVLKMLTKRMEKIRRCQQQNDREQQRITYVRETSECNRAFHQDAFDELTGFDSNEIDARYAVGKSLGADLNALHTAHSVTKGTFFNDATLSGCHW